MFWSIFVAVLCIAAVALCLYKWKNQESEEDLNVAIASGGFACIMLILLAILLGNHHTEQDLSDEVLLYPQSEYQLEIKVHTTEYMNCIWSDTTYVIIKRGE